MKGLPVELDWLSISRASIMNKELDEYIRKICNDARVAAKIISNASTENKNRALFSVAEIIRQSEKKIIVANEKDLSSVEGIEDSMVDRLTLNPERIESMAQGVEEVAALPDCVGEITDLCYRPSGIQVGKMRVPIGVVAVVYESRPNVTVDVSSLCLKSGNSVILRGGSEATETNEAILKCVHQGLKSAGLPISAVQLILRKSRDVVSELLKKEQDIDVLVPRGGKGLIETVSKEARMPVIKHLDGVCHVFVDASADLSKAHDVALNSKAQRYGTCNTMETLLVSEEIAKNFLPRILKSFFRLGVEIRGCEKTIKFDARIKLASIEDWYEEYLAPILAIKIVGSLDEAVDHISTYGSRHTDSIVTEDLTKARKFLREVDSSSVMINASTRFADGYEYGLGAEVGISTDKIHARGPVGVSGLTCQKWVVFGDGHIRS